MLNKCNMFSNSKIIVIDQNNRDKDFSHNRVALASAMSREGVLSWMSCCVEQTGAPRQNRCEHVENMPAPNGEVLKRSKGPKHRTSDSLVVLDHLQTL